MSIVEVNLKVSIVILFFCKNVEKGNFSSYFDVTGHFMTFWIFDLFAPLSTSQNLKKVIILMFQVIL
jgi:hypothetical protein